MTDRPIPFKAPMVRAIFDGRKTQHRIALKPQPIRPALTDGYWWDAGAFGKGDDGERAITVYAPGDRLWVRETWKPHSIYADRPPRNVPQSKVFYRADDADAPSNTKWISSSQMLRLASRLTLIVESVKVERLQEISEEDAIAEGVRLTRDEHGEIPGVFVGKEGPKNLVVVWPSAVEAFRDVWESIYGVESWQKNPWCAAITFRAIHANIDSEEAKAASAS